MRNIKLILFDLDGVLVDMTTVHHNALNQALKSISRYEISDKEYEIYNGLPTKTKLKMLVEKGILKEEQCHIIWKMKQDYTINAIRENIKPDIEKIKIFRDIPLPKVVVTNSICQTAILMLEKVGVLPYCDFIISNEDANPKPSPDGYLKAMKLYSVGPEESIIVEDSLKGIKAAISSNAWLLPVKSPNQVTWHFITRSLQLYNELICLKKLPLII